MRRPYAARRPNKHLAPQSSLTYEVRFAPFSGQSILLDAPLADVYAIPRLISVGTRIALFKEKAEFALSLFFGLVKFFQGFFVDLEGVLF